MSSQAKLFCSFQVDKASSLRDDSPNEGQTLPMHVEESKKSSTTEVSATAGMPNTESLKSELLFSE
jgi:hypothetical protein